MRQKKDVDILMDGKKADMVFTDPLWYGCSKKWWCIKEKYEDIINDDSINTTVDTFHLIDKEIPMIWWGANYYANKLPNQSCWFVGIKIMVQVIRWIVN